MVTVRYRLLDAVPYLIVDRILGREPLMGAWIENLFRRNTGFCPRVLIVDWDNVNPEHICNGTESPVLLSEQLFPVFLMTLSPLAREKLLSLIQSYSSLKDFSAEALNDIYEQLLSIDPELKRPLDVIYLAEVWKRSPNVRPKTQ